MLDFREADRLVVEPPDPLPFLFRIPPPHVRLPRYLGRDHSLETVPPVQEDNLRIFAPQQPMIQFGGTREGPSGRMPDVLDAVIVTPQLADSLIHCGRLGDVPVGRAEIRGCKRLEGTPDIWIAIERPHQRGTAAAREREDNESHAAFSFAKRYPVSSVPQSSSMSSMVGTR